MAFEDLTPSQAQLVMTIINALASGHYKSEFVILYHDTDGGLIQMYGNAGVSDSEIKGFAETHIAALKEEGYLTEASGGRASLKPKAFKEYENLQAEIASRNMSLIDIFISHSTHDTKIAEALTDLLKAALILSAERVRCTSVDGYKLPLGADVNEQLRREIYDAKVFVGIITPTSLESTYVLFELGARWGAKLPMLPVLAAATPNILKEPLKTLNAGCLYTTADVHDLIAEIARQLSRNIDKVAAYEKHIKTLVRRSKPRAERNPKNTNKEVNNKDARVKNGEEADMQMYALLCKVMEETGGNTYTVEPGSPEHLWAERMVQKGLLDRMVSGQFYSLPRGNLGRQRN